MSEHKFLRFLVRLFDGMGAYRTSWRILSCLMKKEAPLPCGLVDVRSYIPGVGFYACHLPQGHDGACALNPAEAYFASVDADKAIKAAETLFRMAAAPPEAE